MEQLTKRQKQAMNTKLRITEKAMELFTQRGFESVKVIDICESASISVGAFYHYFESKEKIIEKIYKDIDFIVAEDLCNIEYSTQTEKILKLFEQANSLMEELGWQFIADSYKHLITSSNKYTLSSSRYPYVSIREAFEEGIKSGEFSLECDPDEATVISMRMGRGMVFDWCLHEGGYSLTTESQKSVLMYLNSIRCNS